MQTLGKLCEYLLELVKNEDQNEMLGLIGVVSRCLSDDTYTALYTNFIEELKSVMDALEVPLIAAMKIMEEHHGKIDEI